MIKQQNMLILLFINSEPSSYRVLVESFSKDSLVEETVSYDLEEKATLLIHHKNKENITSSIQASSTKNKYKDKYAQFDFTENSIFSVFKNDKLVFQMKYVEIQHTIEYHIDSLYYGDSSNFKVI